MWLNSVIGQRYARHTEPRANLASRVNPLLEELRAALSAFRSTLAELPLQHPADLNVAAVNEATEVATGLERAARFMPDDVLMEFVSEPSVLA